MNMPRRAALAALLSATVWFAGCDRVDGVAAAAPTPHAATAKAGVVAPAALTAEAAARARRNARQEKAEATLANIPAFEPQKLGSIRIGSDDIDHGARAPIDEASEFTIDDRGRFGFMPGCGCEHGKKLLLVGRDGAVLKTIDLAGMKEGLSRNVAWLAGDRWVMATSEDKVGGASSAAWLDVGTGVVTPIAGFDSAPVKMLAANRQGGFVALTASSGMFNSGSGIAAFGPDGKPRWKVDVVADSIAVATSGEVAGYRQSDGHLLVIAADGRSRREIDLHKTLGAFTPFGLQLRADGSGGLVLAALSGVGALLPAPHPIVRLRLDGSVIGQVATQYADSRGFTPRSDVEFDAQGRMWANDGHAFLRLDAKGKVDRVVGQAFDPDHLGEANAVAVDASGRIYAVDSWTDSVHVFDDTGRRLRVNRPDPTDYLGAISNPGITVTAAGDAYVLRREADIGREQGPPADFVHYSPLGLRVGVETIRTDDGTAEKWLVQPDGQRRWVFDFDAIMLTDARGKVLRRIDHAGQASLGSVDQEAVAGDGSLAAVGVAIRQGFFPWQSSAVSTAVLLSPRGDVVATWPASTAFDGMQDIAYDGRHVVFVMPGGGQERDDASIVVTDTKGKPQFRFVVASGAWRTKAFLVQRATGTELWVFDGHHTIDRYALTH